MIHPELGTMPHSIKSGLFSKEGRMDTRKQIAASQQISARLWCGRSTQQEGNSQWVVVGPHLHLTHTQWEAQRQVPFHTPSSRTPHGPTQQGVGTASQGCRVLASLRAGLLAALSAQGRGNHLMQPREGIHAQQPLSFLGPSSCRRKFQSERPSCLPFFAAHSSRRGGFPTSPAALVPDRSLRLTQRRCGGPSWRPIPRRGRGLPLRATRETDAEQGRTAPSWKVWVASLFPGQKGGRSGEAQGSVDGTSMASFSEDTRCELLSCQNRQTFQGQGESSLADSVRPVACCLISFLIEPLLWTPSHHGSYHKVYLRREKSRGPEKWVLEVQSEAVRPWGSLCLGLVNKQQPIWSF